MQAAEPFKESKVHEYKEKEGRFVPMDTASSATEDDLTPDEIELDQDMILR